MAVFSDASCYVRAAPALLPLRVSLCLSNGTEVSPVLLSLLSQLYST